MKKPDMNKAPEWAKLWLWSPHFMRDEGYWAGAPDKTGKYIVQRVGAKTSGYANINRYDGIWDNANRPGGLCVKIKISLENK